MTVAYFQTAWRTHVYCFTRGPDSLKDAGTYCYVLTYRQDLQQLSIVFRQRW